MGKDIHLPSLQFEPLDTFVLCGVKIQLTTTKETLGAKEIMTVIAMPGKRLVINLQNSQLSLSEIWAVQVSHDTNVIESTKLLSFEMRTEGIFVVRYAPPC